MSEEKNTNYINLKPDHLPVPIVAVGGSAGGQQAVTELLRHLPANTGLAYVYIQHLSPDYDSHLAMILAAATPMTVREAAPLMPVQPDHLYIIPPNKDMEIVDGMLVLTPRKPKPHIHMPIDQFFISLAERQKDGAIGIVLSGMASDGTLGLKAIKVAGGVTFAQDESAAYNAMPQSAITEGVVDMVLSPKDIALEIARLSKHADIFQLTKETEEAAQDEIADNDLAKVLLFVKSAVGVDFGRYKKTTIRRRIIRRMLLYKLDTVQDYVAYLKQHPAEATILYNDLLINVTSFFRDEQTMDYLKKETIPAIIKTKPPGETIRVWVAACSTGQEAYSLAMIIMEILGDRAASVPIQIFATDLSETAIAKARLGIYAKSEVKEISRRRLDRFFTRTDDHYRINKPVRDLCVFAPHNLLSDPPFSRLDLVSCRNLLIYLDDVSQKKALTTFHYALNPDGVLVLGKSEAVGSSPSHFSQTQKEYKVFSRKNNTLAKIPSEMTVKKSAMAPDRKSVVLKNVEMVQVSDLDKLVDNWLLNNHVPPSVVVDQDMEILQFRGSTGLFLEHATGKASLNLSKMARPSLVFELRNVIHKARKTSQPAEKSGLEVIINNKPHYVGIKAVPITNPANQQLFLILFEELKDPALATGPTGGGGDKQNLVLEAELAALRQDMHSIIEEQEASNEELQSANEEIVSSNEELQSINEELETSKEEIESANEELQTINQELQIRNDQLSESYEYSEAILSTINEATLVLDSELRIKNANKAFYKTFGADPQQTEESMIYELGNGQLDFADFQQVMQNVLSRDNSVQGFEVKIKLRENDERIMVIHARKVVLHQKRTILLVFEDITEHKRAQNLLEERQRWFKELVDNATAFIWVSQVDGQVNFFNKAWLDFTGQSPDRETGRSFLEIIHPEDRISYREVSSNGIIDGTPFSIEYRLRRRDGEYRWVLENTKPMLSDSGKITGYIGTCTDIHLQKTLTEQLNHHVEERTRELRNANAGLETANRELTLTAIRLQSVLNGVPAAVTLMEAIRDQQGEVTDFTTSVYNERALELAGQTAHDILAQTLLEAHSEVRDSGLFALYLHVLNTGEPAYKEVSNLRPGIEETLAFLITRQIDEKGVVVTVLDITNRKQAESNLIRTAESLQAVLDSSPASIGFFKPATDETTGETDFILAVCNQKFAGTLGQDVAALTGQMASRIYGTEQLERMREVLSDKRAYYDEIYLEQSQQWLGVSITRHDHGIAITQMDIGALKHAQTEQDELIRQLEGSYEMIGSLSVMKEYVQHRGSFLRSAFHDLRGSFGIISGAATVLNIMDTEEDRSKTLDMIQRNLGQVAQMMNQLLDYSRLESGQEVLEISKFDVSQLLTELCEGSQAIAARKNLAISYSGTDSIFVESDMVKVRRIAQNLILNALKYTSEGSVTVHWESKSASAEQPDGSWQLTVADTGPGIPQTLIHKLLADDTGSTENVPVTPGDKFDESGLNTGEGIGLFIVKRLCEMLGAGMDIQSDADTGTTFRIVFPVSY
jgi:two-component system CheB/CheR fusion protein